MGIAQDEYKKQIFMSTKKLTRKYQRSIDSLVSVNVFQAKNRKSSILKLILEKDPTSISKSAI